jgi:preprotein translocase subunit SecD
VQKQPATFSRITIVPAIAMLALAACIPMKSRLDTEGGSQLTIQLKPTKEHPVITPLDLEAVQKVIESRTNGLGISEARIQSANGDKVLVQLPSVRDPQQAERVLGGSAQLEFREQKAGTEEKLNAEMQILNELKAKQVALKKSQNQQSIATNQVAIEKQYTEIGKLFGKAVITGKQLKDANPQPSSVESWSIEIEFDAAGGDAFAQLTKKLAGTGRSIGVFVDNVPVSTPNVGAQFAQTGITGGKAVISGNFTAKSAESLAIQLRSGALPVPIEIIENRKIPPK